MDSIRCTQCAATDLESGILDVRARGASGAWLRWASGPADLGFFGPRRMASRRTLQVEAYRCSSCGHLELFTTTTAD